MLCSMAIKLQTSKKKKPAHRRSAFVRRPWLLKLAVFTVLLGGGAAYLIHREIALAARLQFALLVLLLTVIIAGICLIVAVAD